MKLKELIEKTREKNTRFIIVTGGVCSSIGKGILISSIGVLTKNAGRSVSVIKFDPYLNVDPGTMSPLVHGEVFVTDDGAETDLDLGHYERMIGTKLSKESSVSSGQIFQEILQGERSGKFLGQCIQLIPHVVDAIKARLLSFALKQNVDIVLVEIGGTVGDIEGEVFLEAIRQLRMELKPHQMLHAHLSLVPYLSWANEVKTKPTQHSVMLLKRAGLVPDALFLRTDKPISEPTRTKVSVMCGVDKNLVFEVLTRKPVYQLFLDLDEQRLPEKIQTFFGMTPLRTPTLTAWKNLIGRITKKKPSITIGMVVKYSGTSTPYISIVEALKTAAYDTMYDIKIISIDAQALESSKNTKAKEKAWAQLKSVDGILVPGGFDKKGVEGKIAAAQWARTHNIPYFGICLGMQVMLIESARNLLGLADASSTEFNQTTKNPVIALLDEQHNITDKGGTMRLGSYPCTLKPETKTWEAYKTNNIQERHRHRYEFNDAFKKELENAGVVFSGINEKRNLVEIAEIKNHPFMIGTQFHPEFLSNPLGPHPLFLAFIKAAEAFSKTRA